MENIIKNENKTILDRDEVKNKLISYEAAMMRLYRELGLKANQWQLLKAFIIASKGMTEFEASFTQLDNLMVKNGKGSRRSRNSLTSLEKWQDENKIELIRVLQLGGRKRNDSGKFDFFNTRFKFILLDKIVKVFYSDSKDFEATLDKLISKAKAGYKETGKKRKYTPQHNLRKASRTIETKFKKAFELSMEAGLNPVRECQKIMDNIHNIFTELEAETIGNENKAKFKMNFESKLIDNETRREAVFSM